MQCVDASCRADVPWQALPQSRGAHCRAIKGFQLVSSAQVQAATLPSVHGVLCPQPLGTELCVDFH